MRNMQPKSRRITDALLMGLIKGEKEKEGAPLNNPKQAQLAGPNPGLWAKHAGHSLAQIPRPGQNGGPGPGPAQTADTKKNTKKTPKEHTKNTKKARIHKKHTQTPQNTKTQTKPKKSRLRAGPNDGPGLRPGPNDGPKRPKEGEGEGGSIAHEGIEQSENRQPKF